MPQRACQGVLHFGAYRCAYSNPNSGHYYPARIIAPSSSLSSLLTLKLVAASSASFVGRLLQIYIHTFSARLSRSVRVRMFGLRFKYTFVCVHSHVVCYPCIQNTHTHAQFSRTFEHLAHSLSLATHQFAEQTQFRIIRMRNFRRPSVRDNTEENVLDEPIGPMAWKSSGNTIILLCSSYMRCNPRCDA